MCTGGTNHPVLHIFIEACLYRLHLSACFPLQAALVSCWSQLARIRNQLYLDCLKQDSLDTHRIHGTGVFSYIKTIKINHSWIGKYTNNPWIRHGLSWPWALLPKPKSWGRQAHSKTGSELLDQHEWPCGTFQYYVYTPSITQNEV